jgi:hypothetical protein
MRLDHETAARYAIQCDRAGIGHDDAETLRRAALTLHSIAEQECNGTLYRAEAGDGVTHPSGADLMPGKVYRVTGQSDPRNNGRLSYWHTPDRETGARKRIEAIAARIGEGCRVEYQGDPRGWPVALFIAREGCVLEVNPPPCSR